MADQTPEPLPAKPVSPEEITDDDVALPSLGRPVRKLKCFTEEQLAARDARVRAQVTAEIARAIQALDFWARHRGLVVIDDVLAFQAECVDVAREHASQPSPVPEAADA